MGVDEEKCPFCGAWRPGLFGWATVLRRSLGGRLDLFSLIVGACVTLYAFALLLQPDAILDGRGFLSFLAPGFRALYQLGMTSGDVWRLGWWWTLLTAIYLHGGLLHIFFNMMWVRQLGPVVADLFGPFRLFTIFTVAGIIGFLFSIAAGHPLTLGASGSIFGLLAAAIAYGRRTGAQLFTRQFLQWAVLLFIMGFVFPGVDNWAHGGGFAGGYATAWLFTRTPNDREGFGAYVLAGACAVLTVLAFFLQFIAALD